MLYFFSSSIILTDRLKYHWWCLWCGCCHEMVNWLLLCYWALCTSSSDSWDCWSLCHTASEMLCQHIWPTKYGCSYSFLYSCCHICYNSHYFQAKLAWVIVSSILFLLKHHFYSSTSFYLPDSPGQSISMFCLHSDQKEQTFWSCSIASQRK